MCRVKWCNKVDRFYKNGNPKSLCSIHVQYKEICQNATSKDREHLMYKVEKWVKGEHQCEGVKENGGKCGFDPKLEFPSLHTKGQSSTLDVHHIDSDKKGIDKYENPSNYSLLCKNCHTVEGHMNNDFTRKDYR